MENRGHRFKDEWLLPTALKLPGVTEAVVAELRAQKGQYLSHALIDRKLAAGDAIGRAVVLAHRVGYVDPAEEEFSASAIKVVPKKTCVAHHLVPVQLKDDSIKVAMANPLDTQALEDVKVITGREPLPYYCLPDKITALIAEHYSPEIVVNALLERLEREETDNVQIVEAPKAAARLPDDDDLRGPVIRLVNAVISNAVRRGASDIHLEHEENSTAVRLRIDGVMQTIASMPRTIGVGPFVSRIKIMAELDIANRRTPQDGRAKIKVGGVEMGLRISTLPAQYGETVVIRILDPRSVKLSLSQTGIHPAVASRMEWMLDSAQGLLLITGPTGSGKTTTLYAMLNDLRKHGNNIVTAEDPVEYRLEGINQVQVREKQGLNFSSVLRSILRQDPDVIMVGEIRDRKTADIAFQAALTGHFVLTTLHTNDTFSAIARLVDMGVETFKLAPALLGVTAQRLVRRLCADCRAPAPDNELDKAVVAALKEQQLPEKYYVARGCAKCGFTGYRGRVLILEFLELSQALRDRFLAGDAEASLRKTALELGLFRSMLQDALWRLSQGDTSLEEIKPHIRLAAQPDEPRGPSAAAATKEPPAQGKKQRARILVTDDDPQQRSVLEGLLKDAGYQPLLAADGNEALSLLNKDRPDMLIVDMSMPHMDGLGVIRAAREVLGLVSLPIIVVSGDDSQKRQEQAFSLGADDYVIKPIQPSLVLARINALFRRMALV